MSQANSPIKPESVGRISQIIAGALIAGVVMFACVVFFIAKGEPAKSPMLALIGASMAVMAVVVRFIVPTIIVNGGKARLKEASATDVMAQLAGLYQTKIIVGVRKRISSVNINNKINVTIWF